MMDFAGVEAHAEKSILIIGPDWAALGPGGPAQSRMGNVIR
jgi:hypothetical protein